MKQGQLADFFAGVGVKRLSAVEAEPKVSHQHEINTTRKMREVFLGEVHRECFRVVYLWLGEDEDGISIEGTATHYDARLNIPKRTEWRLYYPSNPVTEIMREGDTLFLAKDRIGSLYFIVTPEGSTSEQQLLWLFGVRPDGERFVSREILGDEPELGFAARFILDEIGIEFEEPEAAALDGIIDDFGMAFPTTAVLSDAARRGVPHVRAENDPDNTLLAWLEQEEALFRRLERRIVASRLEEGFVDEYGVDVDGFIEFSLSVQNRRKSRMGLSLENHLERIFVASDVAHVRGAVTENKHRPDFLFPSLTAYRMAPDDGDPCLAMLGAKSTCKDRWRQVLAEAEKIPCKHLMTLEPGISEAQTSQMQAANLQLVVPTSIQDTYSGAQRNWLWSLSEFIAEMKRR